MENINVSDYGIFNDAINDIKSMTSSVSDDLDIITNSVNELDENTFFGPACENFINEYKGISNNINGSLNVFNDTEIVTLQQFSESYQDADKVSASKVGSV